jgi:hypothetical protein
VPECYNVTSGLASLASSAFITGNSSRADRSQTPTGFEVSSLGVGSADLITNVFTLAAVDTRAAPVTTFSAAPAAEPAATDELTVLRARSYSFLKEVRGAAAEKRRAQQRALKYTPEPDAHDAAPAADDLPIDDHDAPMLTKVWRRGADGEWECSQYDNAWLFELETVTVNSLPTLAEALEQVAGDEHACIIRGEHTGEWFEKEHRLVRRTNHRKGDQPAFFSETPRRWLMIDVDSAKLPACMDPLAVEAQALYVRDQLLPEGFRGRACWAQLTGSAGSPKTLRLGVIKLRLAFWLSREINSDEAQLWLKDAEGVDWALFRTVQVHYVAPPPFERGEDFLKGKPRSWVLDGADAASVPDELKVAPLDVSNVDISTFEPLTSDFEAVFRQRVDKANAEGERDNALYWLCCRACEHGLDRTDHDFKELSTRFYDELVDKTNNGTSCRTSWPRGAAPGTTVTTSSRSSKSGGSGTRPRPVQRRRTSSKPRSRRTSRAA